MQKQFLQTLRLFAKHLIQPHPFGLAPNPHVCREVACPLGTASETAREGKHMLSARAIFDIGRTWETGGPEPGSKPKVSGNILWLLSCLLQESNKIK